MLSLSEEKRHYIMQLSNKKLRLSISILVLAVFAIYFFMNTAKFKPLLSVNIWLLLVIALGDVLGIFSNGLFTKFILRPFNKYIGLLESFYVSLISSIGNFFAPIGAGFGFRAVYLKKRHDFAYSNYISTLAGNYIIVFLVNSLAGLIALYLLRGKANSQYAVLAITFAAIFLFALILSLVKLPKLKNRGSGSARKIINNIHVVSEGWNRITSNKRLMLQLIGLTVFNLLLVMGITLAIIHSLHLSIGFAQLLLMSVLSFLSLFINITPANLGIKEAIYIFSSTVIGFSVSQILLIALIDRGVLFVVLASSWLLFGRRTLKRGKVTES